MANDSRTMQPGSKQSRNEAFKLRALNLFDLPLQVVSAMRCERDARLACASGELKKAASFMAVAQDTWRGVPFVGARRSGEAAAKCDGLLVRLTSKGQDLQNAART